jgi:hypothetical protein
MFLQNDRTAADNDEDDNETSSADSNDGNALIDTEDVEEPENVSNSCQWREDFGSFDPESIFLLHEATITSRHVAVKSKESKVMVMVDIFWYLTLLVGSELPSLFMQNVHYLFVQRIKHGSGHGIAYYHFNDFTRLKYC